MITEDLQKKIESFSEFASHFSSVYIAFSAGVDSVCLARMCREVPGLETTLVTADSPSLPRKELAQAEEIAKLLQMPLRVIATHEMQRAQYTENGAQRCYWCKTELYSTVQQLAKANGVEAVFDGTNADDTTDYRPGHRAKDQHGVYSPLALAGISKQQIRTLSEHYQLPTAHKPAQACLASRFPYGEQITAEKLARVEAAENAIAAQGFSNFRVRSHGDLARLEFAAEQMQQAWQKQDSLRRSCEKAGFVFVCIDLKAFQSGSMNQMLARTTS